MTEQSDFRKNSASQETATMVFASFTTNPRVTLDLGKHKNVAQWVLTTVIVGVNDTLLGCYL